MPAFAEVLRSALVDDGIDRLGWVTIRNEPNVPAMPQDFYRDLYVQLDGELTRLGVRSRIRFMGGDLRIENQKDWLDVPRRPDARPARCLLGAHLLELRQAA